MSDSYLDDLIEAALKTHAVVTPRQKRRVWERLEQRAAHQTIWPPLVEPKTTFVGTLRFAFARVRRWLAILLIDEGSYERARKERLALCYSSDSSVSSPQMMLEFPPPTRPQV
jgi:hypothetical protein